MKLNLYSFVSIMGNTNSETAMFAMMVATKLQKAYGLIEKSIDNHNPKTLSALLGFSLNCYEEYMANLHSDIAITDKAYWETFSEYCGRIRSLCNWDNEKSALSVLTSTLTMRKKSVKTESAK